MSAQLKKNGGRGIEWTNRTVGVFGGCMHECAWQMPDGTVAGCYAKEVATKGVAQAAYPHGFEHHYFRPSGLKQLVAGSEPELIFVDSMADAFAPNVPEDQLRLFLDTMRGAPHHAYQSLTKAAPQLLKYLGDLPPNLWVGVSSPPDWMMGKRLTQAQQEAMLKRSLEVLAEVKARTGNIVWMSAEPVSWDLTSVIGPDHPLDWIVIGAASSGPRYFQPKPEHVRDLLEVLDATRTPVFFKGNLAPTLDSHEYWMTIEALQSRETLRRWREDFPTHYRDGSPIEAVERRQRECGKHGWTKIALQQVNA